MTPDEAWGSGRLEGEDRASLIRKHEMRRYGVNVDLAEIAERIDLSRFPIPIRVEVKLECWTGRPTWDIRTIAKVRERDTGLPLEVTTARVMDATGVDLMKEDGALQAIRQNVRDLVMHELDECFLVDGVRAFDPHSKGPPP